MLFINFINYYLKIIIVFCLFILTNLIIFYNKEIKYFNGLVILYFIVIVIIINYIFSIKETFQFLDSKIEINVDTEDIYSEKNKKILKIKNNYFNKSKKLEKYKNDAKLANLFINSLKNENLVNRYIFKILQKIKNE